MRPRPDDTLPAISRAGGRIGGVPSPVPGSSESTVDRLRTEFSREDRSSFQGRGFVVSDASWRASRRYPSTSYGGQAARDVMSPRLSKHRGQHRGHNECRPESLPSRRHSVQQGETKCQGRCGPGEGIFQRQDFGGTRRPVQNGGKQRSRHAGEGLPPLERLPGRFGKEEILRQAGPGLQQHEGNLGPNAPAGFLADQFGIPTLEAMQ
mmetsp:Transcript_8766/g.18898  ORF Transcript_8766/g.18898 Transcript_8766/m.18898 type:complete len:208 (-) Transcript_8766:207-830(-)